MSWWYNLLERATVEIICEKETDGKECDIQNQRDMADNKPTANIILSDENWTHLMRNEDMMPIKLPSVCKTA